MAILSADGWSVTGSLATGATNDVLNYIPAPAGSQEYVWVEILDKNLVSQGVIQFATLTATLYYNAVGSWSMTVPYSDTLWNMIMAGEFIVNINWRGLFSFGGKCEQPGYQDSIPGSTGGAGASSGPFITLSGGDYLALIANRIAYPNNNNSWNTQVSGGFDGVLATPLESAIKHYVSHNIGSLAIAGRQMTLLNIATDQARGNNVSYTVKFGSGVNLNLMDIIRSLIASSGSNMGVSIVRNPSGHNLTFDVYVPRDLSGKAWFSRDLGNLTAVSFALTDMTVTDALVQGSSSFVSRTATGTTQWNKAEAFVDDSSESDANNLNTAAMSALISGAAGPTISATVADTPYLTFGRDYGLGDIVSVEVRPGAVYSDVVTSVTLTADPSQTPMISAVPIIGQSGSSNSTDSSVIGQLTRRIRALEKKLATKLWLHMTQGRPLSPSCRQRPTGRAS